MPLNMSPSRKFISSKFMINRYIWLECFLKYVVSASGSGNKSVIFTTIHVGANPMYGYYFALPVYRVAMEHIKILHPRSLGSLRHIPLYLPGYDACQIGADHTPDFLAKYYFTHPALFDATQFHVFASPECSNEAIQMADLSREFNVPLFTSSAGTPKLTNRTIYPTVNAIASMAGPGVVAAIQGLLQRFAWRNVALICDDLNSWPALATFYSITQCGQILEFFVSQKYEWNHNRFDSTEPNKTAELLTKLKSKTRIIIILTIPKIVRRIMMQATTLNMTSGDYVFISVQPTKRPGVPFITWKEETNTNNDNDIAFNAFKSLIVITEENPDWLALKYLTTEFSNASLALFNFTYPSGAEETELLIRMYESARMFAQVFDENYPDVLAMQTAEFIQKFANRSFDFTQRIITTDAAGALVSSIVILRLNKLTRQMETAMSFNSTIKSFYNINSNLWYWLNRNEAPKDVPACGFLNDSCTSSGLGSSTVTGGITAGVLVFVLIIGMCCLSARQRHELKDAWWLIEADEVLDPEMLAVTTKRDDYTGLISLIVGIKLYYENQEVCLFNLLISENTFLPRVSGNHEFRENLFNLRRLRHPNIVNFIGVVFKHTDVYLLSEYPAKGTLREILGKDQLEMGSDVQYSFCWDILEGVDYIHHSTLGCHGNLNSFVCMIDQRFTLKISQTSYENLADVLEISTDSDEHYHFNAVKLLWQPPEVIQLRKDRIKGRILSLTKETDIYSIGIVFYETLTRVLPYDVNLSSSKSIEVALTALKRKKGFSGVFSESNKDLILPELKSLLESCCGRWKLRPTIRVLKSAMKKIRPKSKSINDDTLHRLEAHATSLEIAIAAKTAELTAEIEHTDRFLQEYLPGSVVKCLRQNVPVPCDTFDCASLLYSDIPMLEKVTKNVPPSHIIAFLNTIYSIFDEQIPEYDVCKIQTTNDSCIVASGLPVRNDSEHAFELCSMAIAIIQASKKVTFHNLTVNGPPVFLRMGIHSGPIACALIKTKMPRYCLIGDSLRTAILMGKSGEAGKIHVSVQTKRFVQNAAEFSITTKETSVKTNNVQTFWLWESLRGQADRLYLV